MRDWQAISPGPEIVIATILHAEGETGVQSHFKAFADYLTARNWPVRILTPFSSPKAAVFPVFAVRKLIDPLSGSASVWWYRYWHYYFLKLALARVLQTRRNVVVYAQCPLSAKAALESRAHPSQRVVMAVHFNVSQADEWRDKGKLRNGDHVFEGIKALETDVLPRVDGIVFVSAFMKALLQKEIPAIERVRSKVVPNFVASPKTEAVRVIKGDLVTVGTLEARKNQAYLLQVIAHAKRLGRIFSLTLIGQGPDREILERLAVHLGVTEQVDFLGYVRNAGALLGGYRCYAHSALMESFGIALIEAMAVGLPVLAGAVGGIPEVFHDGEEGFFWPLEDPEAGAKILISLLDDKTLYSDMSKSAQTTWEERFSTARVAGTLFDFITTGAMNPVSECP